MNDYVIMDRENHASLYDGCKLSYGKMLRFQHDDMADLEKKLQRVPAECGCLIVTDGVFSMGGDIANLPEICRLARQYGARVMVDDAHGLGVIGEGGRGTASYYGLEKEVDIYMGTFRSPSPLSAAIWPPTRASSITCAIPPARSSSLPHPALNCAAALAALRYLLRAPGARGGAAGQRPLSAQRLNERQIKMRRATASASPSFPSTPTRRLRR
jgi:7-keto-8-aminopelargonate synthetase-like enzyme